MHKLLNSCSRFYIAMLSVWYDFLIRAVVVIAISPEWFRMLLCILVLSSSFGLFESNLSSAMLLLLVGISFSFFVCPPYIRYITQFYTVAMAYVFRLWWTHTHIFSASYLVHVVIFFSTKSTSSTALLILSLSLSPLLFHVPS